MFKGLKSWWKTHQLWNRFFKELERLAYQFERRTDCAECVAHLTAIQETFIAEGLPEDEVRRHRPMAYLHYGGIC